jgi:hypothetical protein
MLHIIKTLCSHGVRIPDLCALRRINDLGARLETALQRAGSALYRETVEMLLQCNS